MADYRTLLVAPRNPDLPTIQDEVNSVANALDARLLLGQRATLTGLMDELSKGWDIVWFSTHGSEQGVYLTDGIANTSELTTLIRSTGAVLTVFNTCSSYPVAHAIHEEIGRDFVCTVVEVPDRMAFITATVFAQQIARGMTFYDAYEAAKPGQNSTYVFLSSKGQVMPSYDRGRSQEPSDKRNDRDPLDKFVDLLNQLDAIVNGSPRYHIKGLVKSYDDLAIKIDLLVHDVARLKDNQTFNRRLLIFLSLVCAALLVAVMTQWYMQAGGSP